MTALDTTTVRHTLISMIGSLLLSVTLVGAAVLPAQGAAAAVLGI